MGNYNDFDLDIKKVQDNEVSPTATGNAVCYSVSIVTSVLCTSALSCNGTCTCEGNSTCADTCHNSCGWLVTSCSAHCR